MLITMTRGVAIWLLFAAAAGSLPAAVTAIHVSERSAVLNGISFGGVGAYERIVGRVDFAVNPKLPANSHITDLALAKRNAKGLVVFSADVYILKPVDTTRGNGTVLFEVSNRGGKGMLGMFNDGSSPADPRLPAHFGDHLLMERGFTLVWLGWQFDLPPGPSVMKLYPPVAEGITGLVHSSFTPDVVRKDFPLGDRSMISYPMLHPKDPALRLTVRDNCEAPVREVPRSAWAISPEATSLHMESGFEAGKVYEVVYRAANPPLAALGATGIRDLVSMMKYGGVKGTVLSNEHNWRRAIGFGISQSGRYLRTFLYDGFNADEKGRKVFDGGFAHIAGGGRGSFNIRFAQPSRSGHPACQYPLHLFPFTDAPETDPVTHRTAGLLDRARAAKAAPKMIYTNSSGEYWGNSAVLTHTTVDGKDDLELRADTRSYLLAGTQHGAGVFPPVKNPNQQYMQNGVDYRWAMRALLLALNDWITTGAAPPPSQVPRIDSRRLVSVSELRLPRIPGLLEGPPRLPAAERLDFGPEFESKGIISNEPPLSSGTYKKLVPQVDADGTDLAGIRLPQVSVPLATYLGWNPRSTSAGSTNEVYPLVGSTILFARTRVERQKNRDPRYSLEERYGNKDTYVERYTDAARALARQGYVLDSDVATIIARGAQDWDEVMEMGRTQASVVRPGGR
jgi:hypothetical protein